MAKKEIIFLFANLEAILFTERENIMKVTILGCGSTYGVPVAGGDWGLCDPKNIKNRRMRPAAFIEYKNTKILIDMGPDFREQTARFNIQDLDAVLITHYHADHILGIFELPRFMRSMTKDLNVYTDIETFEGIKRSFYYLFSNEERVTYYGDHRITWNIIKADEEFFINEISILPMLQHHGYMNTMGFRISDFAYNTDLKSIPDHNFDYLKGLKLWVVDCDNYQETDSHNHVEQMLEWARTINPEKVILTHMDEDMDYETLCKILPEHIRPGYDGQVIHIS